MISHAALLDLDPAAISGWHVVVDENLDGSVVSGAFTASASWSLLDRHYRLVPVGETLWEVLPREDVARLSVAQITGDGARD
ncbi:hypothetical protein JNW90_16115 [Micromonospora sp. STR1s_5]|nr:hypothetical protein [Micromonospora sp. STR1s_5]